MRGNLAQTDLLRIIFDHMPDNPLRHADTPALSSTADTAKQPPGRYAGDDDPKIDRGLDPIGHRNCSDMPTLPNKIHNCPVFIAPLQMGCERYPNPILPAGVAQGKLLE